MFCLFYSVITSQWKPELWINTWNRRTDGMLYQQSALTMNMDSFNSYQKPYSREPVNFSKIAFCINADLIFALFWIKILNHIVFCQATIDQYRRTFQELSNPSIHVMYVFMVIRWPKLRNIILPWFQSKTLKQVILYQDWTVLILYTDTVYFLHYKSDLILYFTSFWYLICNILCFFASFLLMFVQFMLIKIDQKLYNLKKASYFPFHIYSLVSKKKS